MNIRALRTVGAAMRSLALAALLSLPAFAQTVYSWEDAEGVHYTDDVSQVPKGAKTVAAPLPDARPSAQRVASAVATNAQAAALAEKVSPPQEAAGVTEREWRDRFIEAHRRIRTLEQSIAAARAALPPRTDCLAQPVAFPTRTTAATTGATPGSVTVVTTEQAPRVRCTVNAEHDRMQAQIAQQEVALRDARLDLEQLDRRASLDSVPREWRRGW